MKLISLAFYNLENFFDTKNDPHTDDDDFTPKGIMHWVKKRYFNKRNKIAKVISKIGVDETGNPPAVIGLAEIENNTVLHDLVSSKHLKKHNYKFVHFESADHRGIDVAMLYRSDIFELLESNKYPVELFNDEGKPYYTRDILYCKGKLAGEQVHLFFNHWPSRREGDIISDQKRYLAATRLREQIDYIKYEEPHSKIIIFGDFNTNPTDKTIKNTVLGQDFFNPAEKIFQQGKGSLSHDKEWMLFDQIMFTNNFKTGKNAHLFKNFMIYNPRYLKVWKGKFKNLPFRTFLNRKYNNGYSDHFPVFCVLEGE